ncbi:unnamed protein product [Brassica oleracea]
MKEKTLKKLFKQQSSYRIKLLSSYKEMNGVVVEMVNVSSTSLTCYMKPSRVAGRLHSSLALRKIQMMLETAVASLYLIFLNFSAFEKMAEELVEMFKREVILKRLLVMELVSLSCEVPQPDKFSWSAEQSFTMGSLLISPNVLYIPWKCM